jgi:small subunit ribosomal protein S16
MAVKIRLQRRGKKGKPFYWVVAADARAKRDGKYLEKIGTYNPNTTPASIQLNIDSALKWLLNGAQPTDTAKSILSKQGVLLKRHLSIGVKKGAFTEAESEEKFNKWVEEKIVKNEASKTAFDKTKAESEIALLKAEKKINSDRVEQAREAQQAASAALEQEITNAAEGNSEADDSESTESK